MADSSRRATFLLKAMLVIAIFSFYTNFSNAECKDIQQDFLPSKIPFDGFPFVSVCIRGNQQWILHKLWSTVRVWLAFNDGSKITKIEGNFIHSNSCEALLEGKQSIGIFRLIPSFLPSGSLLKYRASEIQLSPFTNTCLGVEIVGSDNSEYRKHTLHIKLTAIYYWFPLMFFTGLLLFMYSDQLSRNVMFFYSAGISIGVIASLLIVVFLFSKLIPGRNLAYLSLAGGWSLALAGLTWIVRNFVYLMQQYYELAFCYLLVAGLISFVVCYYYGPPKDERSVDLICWFIQFVALIFLYQSTQSKEVSIALVIIVFLSKLINFSKAAKIFTSLALFRWLPYRLQYKLFPKHRFLTNSEYYHQGTVETKKALEDLRQYCSGPDCDTWKTVRRLKSPARFAEFVSTGKHFNEEELQTYEFIDEDWYSLFSELEDSDLDEAQPSYSNLEVCT